MPVVNRAMRAARLLLPADTDLPMRHWRWLWAAGALRLFVIIPLAAVLAVPYLLFRLLGSAADEMDRLGECCGDFYATCHNRDMWAAGWRPALRRVPAPALSPEWEERTRAGS